jgi:hypothetical protein
MSVHDCRAVQDDDWSYNQPVDGEEIVSMCLWIITLWTANSLTQMTDSQLEVNHVVSNLLSPYSSTLAMQAQNDSCGCGRLIVSGFINAEDNEATEQKTKMATGGSTGSFPGLAHHPKMHPSKSF